MVAYKPTEPTSQYSGGVEEQQPVCISVKKVSPNKKKSEICSHKMVDIVEITQEQWESKKNSTNAKRHFKKEEEGTPLRDIFCLKTRQDMKIFDEKEDCFILDFDPNDSFDSKNVSFSGKSDDEEIEIIHEKDQVVCRDYPHPRHLCLKFPFDTTNPATHCNKCYCYVCDVAAPCAKWKAKNTAHCEALDDMRWRAVRELYRNDPSLCLNTNK